MQVASLGGLMVRLLLLVHTNCRVTRQGTAVTVSVIYFLKNEHIEACFCGDLLVWGGLGSTQFDDASCEQMAQSLKLLSQLLEQNTVICPAHDYEQCFAMTWQAQCQASELLAALLQGGRP